MIVSEWLPEPRFPRALEPHVAPDKVSNAIISHRRTGPCRGPAFPIHNLNLVTFGEIILIYMQIRVRLRCTKHKPATLSSRNRALAQRCCQVQGTAPRPTGHVTPHAAQYINLLLLRQNSDTYNTYISSTSSFPALGNRDKREILGLDEKELRRVQKIGRRLAAWRIE